MNSLAEELRKILADVFTMYLKTHHYHWNIVGSDFVQYHEFLGEIYNDLWNSVDGFAEMIRTIDEPVVGSMSDFLNRTSLSEAKETTFDYKTAFLTLNADNDAIIAALMIGYKVAEEAGEIGISNKLQDRILIHQKHGWMFRSIIK